MNTFERAQRIHRTMERAGYLAAAEEFIERASHYTQREFDRIERAWLPRMKITSPS